MSTNPYRGVRTIETDQGRKVHLLLTSNAQVALEQATGKTLIDVLAGMIPPDIESLAELEDYDLAPEDIGRLSISTAELRALLWAGLNGWNARHGDRQHDAWSLADAGEVMDAAGGPFEVIETLLEAALATFPETKPAADRAAHGRAKNDSDTVPGETALPSTAGPGTGDGS